jgi:hypothetical protein
MDPSLEQLLHGDVGHCGSSVFWFGFLRPPVPLGPANVGHFRGAAVPTGSSPEALPLRPMEDGGRV